MFSFLIDFTDCTEFLRIFNCLFHSLQKLKLSVTPYALDKIKKSAFDEKIKGLGHSEISVVTFPDLTQKAVTESKF